MIELVTDLPIWADCPFKVKKEYIVRRGFTGNDCLDGEKEEIVAVCYEQNGEVKLYTAHNARTISSRVIKLMIRQLAAARLDAEYPGVWPGIVKRQAELKAKGMDLSRLEPRDKKYLKRQAALGVR